jgi:hypothetical protein
MSTKSQRSEKLAKTLVVVVVAATVVVVILVLLFAIITPITSYAYAMFHPTPWQLRCQRCIESWSAAAC